jgi:hypothetical protein
MRESSGTPPQPGEIDETRRKMLHGKPLVSRPIWLMRRLAYVAVLIAGLIAVLSLTHGVWLAIGLTVLAFAASMLPELFTDFRYSNYRREWELANGRNAISGDQTSR